MFITVYYKRLMCSLTFHFICRLFQIQRLSRKQKLNLRKQGTNAKNVFFFGLKPLQGVAILNTPGFGQKVLQLWTTLEIINKNFVLCTPLGLTFLLQLWTTLDPTRKFCSNFWHPWIRSFCLTFLCMWTKSWIKTFCSSKCYCLISLKSCTFCKVPTCMRITKNHICYGIIKYKERQDHYFVLKNNYKMLVLKLSILEQGCPKRI